MHNGGFADRGHCAGRTYLKPCRKPGRNEFAESLSSGLLPILYLARPGMNRSVLGARPSRPLFSGRDARAPGSENVSLWAASSIIASRFPARNARLSSRPVLPGLRPVLMTGTVAALGFVPMTLATGIGAEVQRPLATVIVFSMACDTFLTMLALPVLDLLFGKGPLVRPRSKRSGNDREHPCQADR